MIKRFPELLNALSAALRNVRLAAATTVEQLTGGAHQNIHVARRICGFREDQTCGFLIA